jgi:hypothetical protein
MYLAGELTLHVCHLRAHRLIMLRTFQRMYVMNTETSDGATFSYGNYPHVSESCVVRQFVFFVF